MSDNLYYIPEELYPTFREITLEYSDYHETFKYWWNRTVDAIRQDDFATETKHIFSGLAESKILADDLKEHITSKICEFRQKKEPSFVKSPPATRYNKIPIETIDKFLALFRISSILLVITENLK